MGDFPVLSPKRLSGAHFSFQFDRFVPALFVLDLLHIFHEATSSFAMMSFIVDFFDLLHSSIDHYELTVATQS